VLRYHLAALKGDKEQMNQVVALAKGKHGAEHCVAHAEALALARAGRLQAARLSSNTGHGLGPARRATRDGSKLPGGASGVRSRLRKCRRRKEERHGSAGAFQGPGSPIRRRSYPGFFRGIFSIRGARRRFGKALPGRCFCQIYLCAAFNDAESIGNRSVRILRYY